MYCPVQRQHEYRNIVNAFCSISQSVSIAGKPALFWPKLSRGVASSLASPGGSDSSAEVRVNT